jgi:hypothetical protein
VTDTKLCDCMGDVHPLNVLALEHVPDDHRFGCGGASYVDPCGNCWDCYRDEELQRMAPEASAR